MNTGVARLSKLSNGRLEQDSSYETCTGEMRANGDSSIREENICIHIFTVSSAMVGVCLTVIGLIRVVITLGRADNLADDFLAADALLFLASCLLSYTALRSKAPGRMRRIERMADVIFIAAMIAMVVICGFITYAVALPSLPTHQ